MRNILILLFFVLICSYLQAATNTDKQDYALQNLYTNAGFENGVKDITVGSGGAKTWEGTTKYLGNKSLKCTLDNASEYCETKLVTNPGDAANMEYGFFYKLATASAVRVDVYDGAGNIVRTLNPLPSNTAFQEKILEFVAAANTAYKLRFTALAAADIYIDQVRMSRYMGVGSVDLGEKEYNISSYITGSTLSSVARALATLSKTRDGKWYLNYHIDLNTTSSSSGYIDISGISMENIVPYKSVGYVASDSTAYYGTVLKTSGTRIYYGINTANTFVSIAGRVELTALPTWATDTVSENVVRAENANQFGSVNWTNAGGTFTATAGTLYHASTNTGTVLPLGSVTSGDDYFEMTRSNLQANQVYRVIASGAFYAYDSTTCTFYIEDDQGTTVNNGMMAYGGGSAVGGNGSIIGLFSYSTFKPSVKFSVKAAREAGSGSCNCDSGNPNRSCKLQIEPVYPTANMPQIINSVGTTYQGQTVLNSLRITKSTATNACTSDPCVAFYSTGAWTTDIDRASTGVYTITVASGVFSQPPTCTCSGWFDNAQSTICQIRATSATSITAYVTRQDTNAYQDDVINVICHGNKQ